MTRIIAFFAAFSLVGAGVLAQTSADAATTTRTLSNGCAVSARGIPSCGALMGGAYQSNGDPAPWEKTLGGQLGVRRTYFGSGQIAGAVNMAKADLAAGRLPWMSFKVPYSWTEMVNGKGDAWAKDIAVRLSALNGPVWVAFAHEPENDSGDIQVWKKMQERLGPIVRSAAANVGFTVILMGYHEFYGAAKYKMSAVWPNTAVDLAGFDVYDHWGKNGSTKHTDMGAYFDKFNAWTATSKVPWGLAETGISHAGAANLPSWFSDTYSKMVAKGGKAMAYFNTNLNSFTDWQLSTTLKRDKFAATYKTSPTM
jgi:hypothetical protein